MTDCPLYENDSGQTDIKSTDSTWRGRQLRPLIPPPLLPVSKMNAASRPVPRGGAGSIDTGIFIEVVIVWEGRRRGVTVGVRQCTTSGRQVVNYVRVYCTTRLTGCIR